MSSHPTDRTLEGHRQDALEPAESAEVERHLATCPGCRARLLAEARFDRAVRQALPRALAPPALQDRLRQALAAEAARQPPPRRLSGRRALLAAAALVAAGLGVVILMPGRAIPGSGPAAEAGEAPPAQGRILQGQLVCIGCARHGVPVEMQADCVRPGDPEHVTGLRTPDGNLWRFAAGGPEDPLLTDRRMRGTWVQVRARPYPEIGMLSVASIRRL